MRSIGSTRPLSVLYESARDHRVRSPRRRGSGESLDRQEHMHSETIITREVDALLDVWRQRALTVLLRLFCVITLLPLLAVLAGRIIVVPWPLRALCALLYLVVLTATLRPRLGLRRRVVALISCVAVISAIQLLEGHLSGNGRIALLLLPFLALALVGPRAGWLAAAASAVLFAAVPLVLQLEWAKTHIPGVTANEPLLYWGMQWLLWVNIVMVLMTVLSGFGRLQRRTMIAERMALRQLEAQTADRLRLEEEIGRIGEEERRRLGAELHDGLCQHLTAALLNCTALENRHRAAASPDTAEVTRIREALEGSIDIAYDVAHGLCPVELDAEGLVAALEGLCRTVERRGIGCELQAEGNVVVNPDCALQLYRIAGEAMTNAVKHADCRRMVLRVLRRSDDLVMSVTDDGKGIPNGTGDGLGRRIMRYRAGLMGGEVTVSNSPGQGTTVTCRIPDAGGAS